ncbi:MAG: ATP-binding protein [Thermodesulfobacteriota bacterium]
MSQVNKESLYFYNPWWETDRVSPALLRDYQRPLINTLYSYLSLDRIIVLKGPRRTGKTTLLYQIVDRLIREGTPGTDVLFLSFDDITLRTGLDDILKAYQEITRRVIKEGRPVYIFMDEVQFLENWQFFVKKYFDRKYPIKFLVSGSAASLIKKGSESLAGRTVEETAHPFSMYEYLCYRLRDARLKTALDGMRERFASFDLPDTTDLIPALTEIRITFQEYIERGGFPNLFGIEEKLLWKRIAREDIVEKVIYRDIVELYDIKKPEVLERLFLYLADITANVLSVANIANSLGLSREYTEKYLRYLEQALLVKRISKYARSVEKSVRSAEKVHLLDPGLINAFASVELGQLVESAAACHLLRRESGRLFYARETFEVDLVFEAEGKTFPIEVKYTDSISRRDLRGLYGFVGKYGSDTAVVVTRDLMKRESDHGTTTLYVPAWLFLLLCC